MRHDNAFVIGADNRVGLPVSDAAFCGDNRRPLIDVDAVRNQPAPRIPALAPVVFFAAVTQVKIQRAPVFLVFPDMLIDALASSPATKALDPDPFPRHSLRHAVYAALLHFGFETAGDVQGLLPAPLSNSTRQLEEPNVAGCEPYQGSGV